MTDLTLHELYKIITDHMENEKNTVQSIKKILEKQNQTMDNFHSKVDAHIALVEPYITGAESAIRVGSFLGKTLMALGALVLTVGGAFIFIKTHLFK